MESIYSDPAPLPRAAADRPDAVARRAASLDRPVLRLDLFRPKAASLWKAAERFAAVARDAYRPGYERKVLVGWVAGSGGSAGPGVVDPRFDESCRGLVSATELAALVVGYADPFVTGQPQTAHRGQPQAPLRGRRRAPRVFCALAPVAWDGARLVAGLDTAEFRRLAGPSETGDVSDPAAFDAEAEDGLMWAALSLGSQYLKALEVYDGLPRDALVPRPPEPVAILAESGANLDGVADLEIVPAAWFPDPPDPDAVGARFYRMGGSGAGLDLFSGRTVPWTAPWHLADAALGVLAVDLTLSPNVVVRFRAV